MQKAARFINRFKALLKECNSSGSSILYVLLRCLLYLMKGKKILASDKVIIKGVQNIKTKETVKIGIRGNQFTHKYDRTLLDVKGKLIFNDFYSIGNGCKFNIKPNAIAEFGKGFVNSNSIFSIKGYLSVGDNSVISWGCQLLDHDYHNIEYAGRKIKKNKIIIGNHVWVCSNAVLLKGSVIPDGCVVAANSVVTREFTQKSALIAGNPAKIIKENIKWEI